MGAPPSPLLRLRPRPTVAMVDMVATVDTVARERLRPRLLLLLSPRLMLRPTGLDMEAMVATEDMVATVVRGRLRLPDTTLDMLDMAAMAATEVMVADITDKQIFQSS